MVKVRSSIPPLVRAARALRLGVRSLKSGRRAAQPGGWPGGSDTWVARRYADVTWFESRMSLNDNNYLFLRRFFGGRFEAGSEPPPPAAARRTLFVARVGAAAMGSSGHGCFGYRPRCSARTDG